MYQSDTPDGASNGMYTLITYTVNLIDFIDFIDFIDLIDLIDLIDRYYSCTCQGLRIIQAPRWAIPRQPTSTPRRQYSPWLPQQSG